MTSALAACSHSQNTPADRSISNQTELIITDTAYFAAGCFWCVEAIFESIEGVGEVISGYSGGNVLNPTYEMVCSGKTGHAETVMILYNSKQVLYDTLLMAFFGSHNPETENQQGPDIGTQYRSIIFYNKASEKIAAENYIKELIDQKKFKLITTEVVPLEKFYKAEIYHQNYEENHPENAYVQRVSLPRINKFKAKFSQLLKQR
jgi:peptide-methionine (S)-S-oxide reductase